MWLISLKILSLFQNRKMLSFCSCFTRCEGAASPEGPKTIVEGIIEEEEEEDEEGGGSVNKRKKEDDTEVGISLFILEYNSHLCLSPS